jgi:hypothetical protein
MVMRHSLAVFALLVVLGCAMPGGKVDFPPSPAGLGLPPAADPVLASVSNARSALADPPRRIGDNPPYAARTVGQLEFVAAMIREPRFISIAPIVEVPLARGRTEARAALGLAQDAAPQAVISALGAAAAALERGDAAAAERALAPVSAAPARTIATLRALPFMPTAVNALALTERVWDRVYALDML